MLVSADKGLIEHARKLATQARDPAPHYEHTEIGYNYRLSNVLAAIGRGQLRVLEERVRRKREIFETYRGAPGRSARYQFHARSALGTVEPVADRHHGRSRAVRRHARGYPPGAGGREHRVPAGVEVRRRLMEGMGR